MSRFLGPIHYWLHNKITFLESVERTIENTLEQEGLALESIKSWDEKYGAPNPTEDLETVIDQGNIHGWLQRRIGFAETRFAGKISTLKAIHGDLAPQLALNVFAKEGKEAAASMIEAQAWDGSLQGAHKLLNNFVLEGMPCDQASAITQNDPNALVWQGNRCLHSQYWHAVDGDVSHHYAFRDAFSEAFFDALKLNYTHVSNADNHTYTITVR